jgi:GT2 family glycosyltransferase
MIYIVILNWNGWEDTISCLKSIFQLVECEYRVVVCDNNSENNSYNEIKDWILSEKNSNPYLKRTNLKCINASNENEYSIQENDFFLLQNGKNLGFAGGMNAGIGLALKDPRMKYVWILNNDTEVDKYALSALVKHAKSDSRIGICGSTLLYHDQPNIIQAVGGKYNSYLGTIEHILGHMQYSEALCKSINADEFDYIVGAAMLVSKEFLEQVGLMDEGYFIYFEELDWAMRAKRANPRFKLGYAADSIVVHKEGASIGSSTQKKGRRSAFADGYSLRNRLIFSKKFFPNRIVHVRLCIFLSAFRRFAQGDIPAGLRALTASFGNVICCKK